MKLMYYLITVIAITNGIISCKKSGSEMKSAASLNVINAVIGGGAVKLNTIYSDSANAYNAKSFALNPIDGMIRLYSTSDSLKPYYLQQHELKDGGLYSMFLFGNPPSPEHLFIEENIPALYRDSIVGVRVINLASGSEPVSITRESDESTNIFSEVAYKQLTDIVTLSLPFIAGGSAYIELRKTVNFQVRDAGGTILATYQLPVNVNSTYPGISINLQRFKNITLVIKGIAGVTDGPDAFGVYPVVCSY